MRNRSTPGNRTRAADCSDFLEMARRMSIPTEVAMQEFMDLATRPRPVPSERALDRAAELATTAR